MPTFSHSRIECFRHCPRKYYYQYVGKVKLPESPRQIFLFLGTTCHDSLEWLYNRVTNGHLPSRDDLLNHFDALWDSNWGGDIEIHDERDGAEYKQMSRGFVERYYDQYYPFDDSITIDTERMITFQLDESESISMRGYIDRLSKDKDGVWHIHDYKTNKKLPTQAEKDADPQLAYYEIGIREMWPEIERVELHWHFLKFGETITSTRTAAQLEQIKQDALSTIRDATRRGPEESAYETNETALCNYCDYKSICPVKKHEFRINGLPENEYLLEPSVNLVNMWAEFNEQKKALKKEIDLLEDKIDGIQGALLHLAEDEGLTTVCGKEYEACIKQDKKIAFPLKSGAAEDYRLFEQLLMESKHWDLVSSIDQSAVKSIWKSPTDVPEDLTKILEGFVREEESTKITIRKRK